MTHSLERRIVFLNTKDAGKSVDLPDRGIVRLGRNQSNHIVVPDKNASRVHCQLLVSDNETIITDLNSANGTLVNGVRIGQKLLANGDMITIGFTRLRFEQSGVPAEQSGRPEPFMLCIQCGRRISLEEADAGQTLKIGSVYYCNPCAEKLRQPEPAPEPAEPPDTLLVKESFAGGDRVGPYRVMQRVGYGFGGFYWLAEEAGTERKLALKIYDPNVFEDPQWAEQFMREIRRASRFVHQNVVRVFDAGLYDGRFAVAMEFVRGASLREVFNARNRVPPKAALGMAADLLKALAYLEEESYAHGDVQPAAVMVVRTGAAKLGDFGLRMTLPAFGPGARFKASRGMDYLRYYAPEQFDAHATLDRRSDLYGVGAVLYHLLCMRPPFGATNAKDLVTSIRNVMPIPPGMVSPGLPPAVNSIIARAMAKDPGERYQRPAEFLADIEALLSAPGT